MESKQGAAYWEFRHHTTFQDIPSLPLAEQLAPELSQRALKNCLTLSTAEGFLLSAWSHLEYALNQSIHESEDIQTNYIADVNRLIGWIMNAGSDNPLMRRQKEGYIPSDATFNKALILSSYMPVFSKRIRRKDIQPEDCESLYVSLGRALESQFTSHKPQQAQISETLLLGLSARTLQPELLLYPSSTREEHSAVQPVNHDSYFVHPEKGKVPVQAKIHPSCLTYDESIHVVTVEPLARRAIEKAGISSDISPDTLSPHTLSAASLYIQETRGDVLSPQEKFVLDYMGRFIAGQFRFAFTEMKAA